MNHIKLLYEVISLREVLFSKRSVGVWCAVCARMCGWHSVPVHGRLCSQRMHIMLDILTCWKNTQATVTLTNSIIRRWGDKTGVNKISPLLPHLLNRVEFAGRRWNSKRPCMLVYKPLRSLKDINSRLKLLWRMSRHRWGEGKGNGEITKRGTECFLHISSVYMSRQT